MLKQVHNLIISVIAICFLSIPQIALAQNSINSEQNEIQKEEYEYVQSNMRDTNVEPMNTESIKNSVIPDTAKEGKKVIGLFLTAMVLVGFAALFLYLLLVVVKKYYPKSFNVSDCEEYENLDLSTPDSKNSALKSFLNRTK